MASAAHWALLSIPAVGDLVLVTRVVAAVMLMLKAAVTVLYPLDSGAATVLTVPVVCGGSRDLSRVLQGQSLWCL